MKARFVSPERTFRKDVDKDMNFISPPLQTDLHKSSEIQQNNKFLNLPLDLDVFSECSLD